MADHHYRVTATPQQLQGLLQELLRYDPAFCSPLYSA